MQLRDIKAANSVSNSLLQGYEGEKGQLGVFKGGKNPPEHFAGAQKGRADYQPDLLVPVWHKSPGLRCFRKGFQQHWVTSS